ncbi:hypothetical protein K466DRAFT_584828 [Polyporus arcularius HHB13444]|uniref:BTB domain-containing protein n=1 Tax=Polyporus arcularius HHB13444 TaxID=1314778 RepID=A0A5C3PHG2_9APHY|nr:hypothetical protein K466DRAFT_584828 [Polyporus arcularius HHB13444]
MEETREDLEVLLNVIYDGLHIDVHDFTVETFPTLATVLRMASKYKIERPCQAIVARIRQQWPASLADHDALVAQVRAPVAQQLGADDKGKARDAGPLNANMNANPLADINAAAADYFRQQAMRPSASGPQLPASYARDGPIMINPSRRRMAVPAHIQPLAPPPNMAQPVNYGAHFLPMGMGPPAAQAERNDTAQEPIPGPSNAKPAAPAVGPAPAQAAAAAAAPAPPAEKEDLIIHPASVIAVLRECGYSDAALFFPLFYALSRTTAQFGGGALGYHLAPLSAADMERFVVGIERLRARHTALVVSTPSFDSVRTPGGSLHFCREGARELWTGLVYTLLVTNEQHAHEPVEEWQDMVASVNAQYGRYQVCAECCKAVVAKIQTYRVSLWDSLPRFFELA